ncbi:MAG: hypothetical protein KDE28_29865, partial [Anaerolineales bacterium]|nr:hypothetical protein [Anaerolineales bacterium]
MSLLKPNDVALKSHSHTHKDLFAWQHTLENQLAGGDILLGQLPHGQSPYDIEVLEELTILLQQVFARYSFHDALQVVEKSYPLPYALFIVL